MPRRREVEIEEKTAPEVTEEKPAEAPPETPEGAHEEKPEPQDGEDALPEWARKELTKVRGEAANYRTKLREAEQKLSEAKTPEEVNAAISELREQNEKLERSILVNTVATKYELTPLLASRLVGSTEAELEADAKLLAAALPAAPLAPPKLAGGLDPSDDSDTESDPRKLARRSRRI